MVDRISLKIQMFALTMRSRYKIVFLGNTAVGKTTLISQIVYKVADASYNPTIGIDFLTTKFKIDNKSICIQLWDTAGQERFNSIIPNYTRDCFLAIIVFSLMDPKSMAAIDHWIEDLVRINDEERKVKILIVGNKKDLFFDKLDKELIKYNKTISENPQKITLPSLNTTSDFQNKVDVELNKVISPVLDQDVGKTAYIDNKDIHKFPLNPSPNHNSIPVLNNQIQIKDKQDSPVLINKTKLPSNASEKGFEPDSENDSVQKNISRPDISTKKAEISINVRSSVPNETKADVNIIIQKDINDKPTNINDQKVTNITNKTQVLSFHDDDEKNRTYLENIYKMSFLCHDIKKFIQTNSHKWPDVNLNYVYILIAKKLEKVFLSASFNHAQVVLSTGLVYTDVGDIILNIVDSIKKDIYLNESIIDLGTERIVLPANSMNKRGCC